jgi:hypothetical protein
MHQACALGNERRDYPNIICQSLSISILSIVLVSSGSKCTNSVVVALFTRTYNCLLPEDISKSTLIPFFLCKIDFDSNAVCRHSVVAESEIVRQVASVSAPCLAAPSARRLEFWRMLMMIMTLTINAMFFTTTHRTHSVAARKESAIFRRILQKNSLFFFFSLAEALCAERVRHVLLPNVVCVDVLSFIPSVRGQERVLCLAQGATTASFSRSCTVN